MTWIIRGDPKPFSAQFSARMRIRSISGFCRKVSGSTSGNSGLVKLISALLYVCWVGGGWLWLGSVRYREPLPQTAFVDLADGIFRQLVEDRDLNGQFIFRQRLVQVLANQVDLELPAGMR